MYSLVTVNGGGIKKAKGVNRNVVDSMKHKGHNDLLFDKRLMRHSMKRIQSKSHSIGIYDACKISLSCFDKRYILNYDNSRLAYFRRDCCVGISSLAYFIEMH